MFALLAIVSLVAFGFGLGGLFELETSKWRDKRADAEFRASPEFAAVTRDLQAFEEWLKSREVGDAQTADQDRA